MSKSFDFRDRATVISSQVFMLAGVIMAIATSPRPMRAELVGHALYFQQSGAAALGKLRVEPKTMAGRLLTMVSPAYPRMAVDATKATTLVIRVAIAKSGRVTPITLLSGDTAFEVEAFDALRLWRYRPFTVADEPVDVITDVPVDFAPGKPGGMVTHPNH